LKLVVEVDGITHILHDDVQLKDVAKDAYLQSVGYKVLRFKDEEVLKNVKEVVRIIEVTIDEIVETFTSTPVLKDTPASGG
jgi:very-short-patch-repair endonuclease